jgi:hypothetical protein
VEAGDRIAADGRLALAANLEIDESTLTGESAPVAKSSDVLADSSLAIGDRTNMGYTNTLATRGRGEIFGVSNARRQEVFDNREIVPSIVSPPITVADLARLNEYLEIAVRQHTDMLSGEVGLHGDAKIDRAEKAPKSELLLILYR